MFICLWLYYVVERKRKIYCDSFRITYCADLFEIINFNFMLTELL